MSTVTVTFFLLVWLHCFRVLNGGKGREVTGKQQVNTVDDKPEVYSQAALVLFFFKRTEK